MSKKQTAPQTTEKPVELDLTTEKQALIKTAEELNVKPNKLAKLIKSLDEKTSDLFTSSQFVAEQFEDAVEVRNLKTNLDFIYQNLDEAEKLLTEALGKE